MSTYEELEQKQAVLLKEIKDLETELEHKKLLLWAVEQEYDRMYYSGIPDERDTPHKDMTNYKNTI